MLSKLKILALAAAAAVIISGCTCVQTHVPGRAIDHGPYPDEIDVIFCHLDYLLFPPEQQ